MTVLLDIIAFDYLVRFPENLSAQARSVVFSAETTLLLSIVSVWELSIHAAQQRIIFDAPFAATLTTALYSYSIDLLPVTLKDTARNAELPFLTMNGSEHRDPFDRLIIAQGLLRGLPIVTKDRKFASYGIEVIW